MGSETVSPYVWMLCGSFSFAVMSTLAHMLGERLDWQVVALSRAFLALFFAVLLGLAARIRFVFARPRVLWVRSLSGSVSLVCTFYCLPRLPVSEVLTLTNIYPMWVALLAWPLYKEPPTGQVWLSLASSLAGVVLIQQPHFVEGNFAALLLLFSSVATAVAMLGLHELQFIDARAIVAHFSGVSTLFCIAAWLGFEHRPIDSRLAEPTTLGVLLTVGLTATIGQLFLTKAFAAGPPAKVAVIGLMQVVFAMAFDLFFLGTSFNTLTLVGMALILAPTAWLMLQRGQEMEGPASP